MATNNKDPSAHHGIATAFRDLGRLDEAIAHFKKADELHPNPVSRAALASLFERAHRLDEAVGAAERTLKSAPFNGEALLVLAKIEKRRGNFEEAKSRYKKLDADLEAGVAIAAPAVHARCKADLATIYESQDNFKKALSLFAQANSINCSTYPDWKKEADRYLERVRSLRHAVCNLPRANAERASVNGKDAPIFIVGFPRSGTTLLDQLLNAHSKLWVMEEKTILDRVSEEMGGTESDRPARAHRLPEEEKARLRKVYSDECSKHLPQGASKLRLVDKLPLNILNLWLIGALYPGSKVVLALRDPRDVCWSCYSNLFRLGPGIAGFADLPSTAALYAEVMELWRASCDRLPVCQIVVRYEDLVNDIEETSRRLLQQLDLPWENQVLRYRESVQKRFIATPSYHQVALPLYQSSIGRWCHYEEALRPVMGTLAPYLEEFGYT